jgi:plastocyanin
MPSVRLAGERSRRLVLPALVAGAFLALAGGPLSLSGPAAAQPAPAAKVSMKDFAFMPADIKVTAGTTVTWTYDESVSDPMPNCETVVISTQCPGHTATANDKGPNGKAVFDSGNLKGAGASYSFTFINPGTYTYYCVYHGGTTETGKNNPLTNMNGTVVVEAAAAAATPAGTGTGSTATTAAGGTRVGGQGAARAGGELSNTGGGVPLAWGLLPLAAFLWFGRRRSI